MPKTKLWSPKAGDLVKYVAVSSITGKLVNIRAETVVKITDKYIYAGRGGQKFLRGAPGRSRGFVPKTFAGSSTLKTHIEPLSDVEAATLPRDLLAGSQYARQLNHQDRQSA